MSLTADVATGATYPSPSYSPSPSPTPFYSPSPSPSYSPSPYPSPTYTAKPSPYPSYPSPSRTPGASAYPTPEYTSASSPAYQAPYRPTPMPSPRPVKTAHHGIAPPVRTTGGGTPPGTGHGTATLSHHAAAAGHAVNTLSGVRLPAPPQPALPHVPAAILPASWLGLAIAIALLLNGMFIGYLVVLVCFLLRHRAQPRGNPDRFAWHFLVPCRDEEAVIGGTVDYLMRSFPQAHVWVIDDDSDDATAAIVGNRAAVSDHVHLVARRRPHARTGKSEALNAAYRTLSGWLPPGTDRSSVVLAVVDADGRPAPGCLEVVAADHLFGRPQTGAVQIEVRMINRDDRAPLASHGALRNLLGRVLVRLQDIEFRAVVSAVQVSRRTVHTVAMGGNGQFMRLSVLDEIGSEEQRPWRGSLQEDFEVGLHVLLAGSRTEYTPDTWVDQEALPHLGRLLTQRTRWSQGMMQCIRYLPRLWRSGHLSNSGVLELSYCLVQPWVQLATTFLYPLPWLALGVSYLRHPYLAAQFGPDGGWTLLALYVVAALTQLAVWGIVYWRKCERSIGAVRAIAFGAAFSMLVYISYAATWRALFRIVRRRGGWSKTRRNAEIGTRKPIVPA